MDGACSMHRQLQNLNRIFGRNSEGKRPLGRPKHRWDNNIKIDLWEMVIGYGLYSSS
jgi:hypothetical protein